MSRNLTKNSDIYDYCFNGLLNKAAHGRGTKTIAIKFENTITEKYPFSGFGFKNEDGELFIGLKMYYDQGDFTKLVKYDDSKTIIEHWIQLVNDFQNEM